MDINQMNILIVEDDDFQREMLSKMLNTLKTSSVVKAANGKQALEIIHNNKMAPIDVVLCDLNMPEMDGMEFLRHLGEEHQHISIIITSALDSRLLGSVARMSRIYGINLLGTIEKPVMLEPLKLLLARHRPGSLGAAKDRATNVGEATRFSLEEVLQGINEQQFVPFYQPKVDLQSGQIIGAEALARWQHPVHGIVTPAAFIAQLEDSANIDALTFGMLRHAAAQSRLLLDRGYPLTISVNLSLVSLDDPTLAHKITNLVKTAHVDPKYIILEITESAAVSNVARVLENLARLCMNGFALSIDDYGTGYSSMQQLTRIAFSELKIDQSFVKDFADNPELGVIVASSIDMAHKLNMKCVAEGVESQQDWDNLKKMSCDVGQGYYIARPMSAGAFLDFVQNMRYVTDKTA